MAALFRPAFLVTLLIVFTFPGVTIRAAENTPDPAALKALVTPEQFTAATSGRAEELGLQGLLDLEKQGPVVVLDVRSKESFAARHLKGSVNVPLTELTEKTLPAAAPSRDTPVVLACDYSFYPVRMLAMTLQAYPVLKTNGYTKIYRLNLWQDRLNNKMLEPAEQEKYLAFEGTAVTPPAPAEGKKE